MLVQFVANGLLVYPQLRLVVGEQEVVHIAHILADAAECDPPA